MEVEKSLGTELRAINNLIERRMHSILSQNEADDITPMHSVILGYLSFHADQDIYQRDIETHFHITRSTVASILKLMEQKGYICRVAVPHDARLKKIVVTELGSRTFVRINSSIRQIEEIFRSAVTPEEYIQLMALLHKVKLSLIN